MFISLPKHILLCCAWILKSTSEFGCSKEPSHRIFTILRRLFDFFAYLDDYMPREDSNQAAHLQFLKFVLLK